MTDARQDVKDVRISIEEGVITLGSGYDIGARLRKASNIVHNWIDQLGQIQFPFSYPDVPSDIDVSGVSFIPAAQNPNGTGYWQGQDLLDGAALGGYFIGAETVAAPNTRVIYDIKNGVALGLLGNVLGIGPVSSPWSFAFAGNISEPTTFVSAGGSDAKKKIINIAGTLALRDYNPFPFDPDSQPDFEKSPRVLYYHLNRLFLGYQSIIARRSLVFYSDPFDPNLIRGNNFLDIPDMLNVMFRTACSDVDLGGVPHLFFGCDSQIFVLDGDPNQGNAIFRSIKKNFGIRSLHHVAEISGGVCFLATDGRIYFLAAGQFEPAPISDSVQNQFNPYIEHIYLGWRNPYLYVFDGISNVTWIANISNQGVSWSGPHASVTDFGAVRGFVSDHPSDPEKNFVVFGDTSCIAGSLHPSVTQELFQTGYIFEPDHDVVFKRAKFKFRQIVIDQEFVLRITNHDGQTDTRSFTIPGRVDAGDDTVFHSLVVFDPDSISVGRFFFLELSGLSLKNILDWRVEYRVVPRKD